MSKPRIESLHTERTDWLKRRADELARLETAKEGLRAAAAKKHLTGKFIHSTAFRELQQAKLRSISEIARIDAAISDVNAEIKEVNREQHSGWAEQAKQILADLAAIKAHLGITDDE